MVREKYKELFKIDEEDYKKAKEYYDKYLAIFDSLLKPDNDSSEYEKIRKEIEDNNPWKENLEKEKKCVIEDENESFIFKSLAGSDREILGKLLIKDIKRLRKQKKIKTEGKVDPKKIIQARFGDFEQAFIGNFINPKVIIVGINPRMSGDHKKYGLKNTVYEDPFDSKRPILKNSYYFGEKICSEDHSFFYIQGLHEDFRKKHIEEIFGDVKIFDDKENISKKFPYGYENYENKKDTPVALLEIFPYASNGTNNWQDGGYTILPIIQKYIKFEKVLPSQIWILCLLTFAIKTADTKLRLIFKKRGTEFEEFLNQYFGKLKLKENIDVIIKKHENQAYTPTSRKSKPYFEGQTLEDLGLREDNEGFFKDLWDPKNLWKIENKDQ